MIKFRCQVCNRKLGVPAEFAGKWVKCTGCHAGIIVPEAEPAAAEEELDALTLEPVEEDDGSSFLDDLMPAEPPPPAAPRVAAMAPAAKAAPQAPAGATRPCPKCGAQAKEDAAICVRCGHSFKLGMNVKNVIAAKKAAGVAGRTTIGLIAGGVTALVCGAIWAGIVMATGYEIGYVAWGVGLATGLAVAVIARTQNGLVGVAAAGLALLGLFVGKVLILQYGIPSMATKELLKDRDMIAEVVAQQMHDNRELDAEAEKAFQAIHGNPFAEPDKHLTEVVLAKVATLSAADKQTVIRRHVDTTLGSLPFGERLRMVLSPWDALWGLLALGTALKVGSGAGGND